ncbi:MAG TPA: cyclic nucleotide-binding domain-containing protein [Polyangiales bacterium]
MQPNTVADARTLAERALTEARFEDALALYAAGLASEPDHLDLRLRVADCLLSLGKVQEAAVVYTTLAKHAANLGYPLRAVVAIKVLHALEPALGALMQPLAELYASESKRTGLSVRPVPASETGALDAASLALLPQRGPALVESAVALGRDLSRCSDRYPEVLPPIPLLSELSQGDFVAVLETVTLVRKPAGARVLAQGDAGSSFFIAARGNLEVVRDGEDGSRASLATLHEGAVFGEMALLSKSGRGANVDTLTETDLLELHVEALTQLSSGAQTIARALDRFTRERLVMNLIATAPLFRPLDRGQRLDLVRRFVAHEVAAGTDLIREGENVPGLYLVLSGAVDVWKRDGDQKVLLATLSTGEVFGEMSLLNATRATASVTAAQRTTVLLLAREYVERLIQSLPALRAYLEGLGDERAMDTRMWLDNPAVGEDF